MPVDTLSIDTIAPVETVAVADTLFLRVKAPVKAAPAGYWTPEPGVLTGDTLVCVEADAPRSAAEALHTICGKVGYYAGIPPVERAPLPGYDSSVMGMVMGVFLIMALNLRHYSTFLKTFWANIFSVRKRSNAFDERATVSEARVLLSLVLMLCMGEGIMLYSAINAVEHTVIPPFEGISMLSLLALVYYLWQLAAYRITGYTFTTRRKALSWFKGFTASQALLAILIAPPAIVLLFMPGLSPILVGTAVILYIGARLLFIIKGFKIFYHNYLSLVYFILYLCTLEIIPLICVYQIAIYTVVNI